MKFFTPDLDVRFNSDDEDEADEADRLWDLNVQAYAFHLKQLLRTAPELKRLAEQEVHDAEVLSFDQFANGAPNHKATAVLSVSFTDQVYTLIYQLSEKVRVRRAHKDWPFSDIRTHWLYDEIDAQPNRRRGFIHRVLLADGRILVIPFVSVIVHTLPIAGTTIARRIA